MADQDVPRDELIDAAKKLATARTGIILTGRIVNGKLEIDQSCLDEIAKNFPNANRSFIAVNAPFDPERVVS
jgi:hypothetical protein